MPPRPRELLPQRRHRWLATAGGAGLVPLLPGTAGSLVAVGLALFMPVTQWPSAPLTGALLATLLCQRIARNFPQHGKDGDPSWFVLDEVAGQWLALALVPPRDAISLIIPFILFRIFDMTKPFPLRRLESLPRGWGIVADDLGAGLYALLVGWPLMAWLRPA